MSADVALREIRLYGHLAARFGRVHHLAVSGAAEAVRALCTLLDGFEEALRDARFGYRVRVGDRSLDDAKQLHDPSGRSETIRIVPVLVGGKSKWLGIILGVVLIAAAVVNPLAFFGGAPLLTGVAGQLAINAGAALIIGGIAQMLAPQPKYQAGSDVENKPSYVFSGAQNTAAQGLPIPVGYGRMIVGSLVVSAAVTVEEYSTSAPIMTGPGGGTGSPTAGEAVVRSPAELTVSSNVVNQLPSTTALRVGMRVDSAAFAAGTVITAVLSDTAVQVSNPSTSAGAQLVSFADTSPSAAISRGGTGNGPYTTNPGYTYPQAPGDKEPNIGPVVDRYNLAAYSDVNGAA